MNDPSHQPPCRINGVWIGIVSFAPLAALVWFVLTLTHDVAASGFAYTIVIASGGVLGAVLGALFPRPIIACGEAFYALLPF